MGSERHQIGLLETFFAMQRGQKRKCNQTVQVSAFSRSCYGKDSAMSNVASDENNLSVYARDQTKEFNQSSNWQQLWKGHKSNGQVDHNSVAKDRWQLAFLSQKYFSRRHTACDSTYQKGDGKWFGKIPNAR